jgi:hypothetical protein
MIAVTEGIPDLAEVEVSLQMTLMKNGESKKKIEIKKRWVGYLVSRNKKIYEILVLSKTAQELGGTRTKDGPTTCKRPGS